MGKLLTDETGKKIVDALNNTETAKQRIAEINASAESAKQSALNAIQEMKNTIPADYSELNYDMLMLMPSLVKKTTGNGIVNITNTAQGSAVKVTSNGGVTIKNKNIFEDILIYGTSIKNCKVNYENGEYIIEYKGDGTTGFTFGNGKPIGEKYQDFCGKKLKYDTNLSIKVNCDMASTVNGCIITYYSADGISLLVKYKGVNKAFKIDEVEGAEFFTLRLGFDEVSGITAGDIVTMSVQIEYGDTVSDFVPPLSNTDNLAYEDVTNIVGDGEITVEYVPDVMSYIDKIATALVAHESEVN